VRGAYEKLPLSFEENRGQVDPEVRYLARDAGYTLFLTETEAVLSLPAARGETPDTKNRPRPRRGRRVARVKSRPTVLRMRMKGANSSPAVVGESETGVRANYFKGSDPRKWHTEVPRYARVRYAQVYPGVDVIYYGERQQLEYDFEVAPGADTRQIVLEFEGVRRVKVERATGELMLKTAGGEVRQRRPAAYQGVGGERREVASRYVMKGRREVGIEVGEYDRAKPLVIDPVLTYSTFLGGTDSDYATGIAVDSSGHAYVTGDTYSSNFPKRNQYQSWQGTTPFDDASADAFVTKLDTNASGPTSLLYSTYLGGSDADRGLSIAADSSGNAYVTGWTDSADFPTLNPLRTDQPYADAFVTKLDTNQAGAASLRYSTYLGGRGAEFGQGIAVDSVGNVYATGWTTSSDFPVLNQYQSTKKGYQDAFVTKLNPDLPGAAALLYSTYLGGGDFDYGYGIAVDSSGNAYVTGSTESTDFPTLNACQSFRARSLEPDAFVVKLDTNASGTAALRYGTYLGGSGDDWGTGIAADSSGGAYVTGITGSSDFPTRNQFQTFNGGWDAFVTKLNTNLAGTPSLRYSTYLGGDDYDSGNGVAVDQAGNVYVTGLTISTDFPTLNRLQKEPPQYFIPDAFVTKLNPRLSGRASVLYSTYLGGKDSDIGYAIAVDSSGNAYVTGETFSTDFPKVKPFQAHRISGIAKSAFVTKLADSYRISGRVTSDGTTGISAVTMTLGGSANKSVLTNGNGYYAFDLVAGGNYTLTPTKGDLTFVPFGQTFVNLHENQTDANFTTRRATVSGRVTLGTATGKGLAGVTMTLTGGTNFAPRAVITSSTGTYSFDDLPTPRSYKVTPSKTSYNFDPAQLALPNLTGNHSGANFVASPKTNTGP
jgi:hypothetical protein